MMPGKLHAAFPLVFMAVLYWLSSLPLTSFHEDPALYGLFYRMPSSVQNALHVPAYAILAWTTWWALGAWQRAPGARVIGACAIAAAYGIFDEWHQFFVPGRACLAHRRHTRPRRCCRGDLACRLDGIEGQYHHVKHEEG